MTQAQKTIKITLRLPKFLRKEMLQAIIDSNYGMRGKSKWLVESIIDFLKKDNFIDFVDIGSEMSSSDSTIVESFYLPIELLERIDLAIVEIRRKYPMMEGVRSIIIRSSIIQRLLRPNDRVA